jgi:hypothetical protein
MTMAGELTNTLKRVAEKIASYVDAAAKLEVKTSYVEVGGSTVTFENPKVAASTVIKMDGDSEVIVPVQRGGDGQMLVDSAIFELHERNVATAIEYRAKMMQSLLQAFRDTLNR